MPSHQMPEDYRRFESWLLSLFLCLQARDKEALATLRQWVYVNDDDLVCFDKEKGWLVGGITLYQALKETDEKRYAQLCFLVAQCTFLGIEFLDTFNDKGEAEAVYLSKLCQRVGIKPWHMLSPEVSGVAIEWFEQFNVKYEANISSPMYQQTRARALDRQLSPFYKELSLEDNRRLTPMFTYTRAQTKLPASLNRRVYMALHYMDDRVTNAFQSLKEKEAQTLRQALDKATKAHAIDWEEKTINTVCVDTVDATVKKFDDERKKAEPRGGWRSTLPVRRLAHRIRFAVKSHRKKISRKRKAVDVYKKLREELEGNPITEVTQRQEATSASMSPEDENQAQTLPQINVSSAALILEPEEQEPMPRASMSSSEDEGQAQVPQTTGALLEALSTPSFSFRKQLSLLKRYIASHANQDGEKKNTLQGCDDQTSEKIILALLKQFPSYFKTYYPAPFHNIYAKASRRLQKICSASAYNLWRLFINQVESLDRASRSDAFHISVIPKGTCNQGQLLVDRLDRACRDMFNVVNDPQSNYGDDLRKGIAEATSKLINFFSGKKAEGKCKEGPIIRQLENKLGAYEASYKAMRKQCGEALYREGSITEDVQRSLRLAADELFVLMKTQEKAGDLKTKRMIESYFDVIKEKRKAWHHDLAYLLAVEKPIAEAYHKKASAAIRPLAHFSKDMTKHSREYWGCYQKARKKLLEAPDVLPRDLALKHPELHRGIGKAHQEYAECLKYFERLHHPSSLFAELFFEQEFISDGEKKTYYLNKTRRPSRLSTQFRLSNFILAKETEQKDKLATLYKKWHKNSASDSVNSEEHKPSISLSDNEDSSTEAESEEEALPEEAILDEEKPEEAKPEAPMPSPLAPVSSQASALRETGKIEALKKQWKEDEPALEDYQRRFMNYWQAAVRREQLPEDYKQLAREYKRFTNKLNFKYHSDKHPHLSKSEEKECTALYQEFGALLTKIDFEMQRAINSRSTTFPTPSQSDEPTSHSRASFRYEQWCKEHESRSQEFNEACDRVQDLIDKNDRDSKKHAESVNRHLEKIAKDTAEQGKQLEEQGKQLEEQGKQLEEQGKQLTEVSAGLAKVVQETVETGKKIAQTGKKIAKLEEAVSGLSIHDAMENMLIAVEKFTKQSEPTRSVTDFYKFSASGHVPEPLPSANSHSDPSP